MWQDKSSFKKNKHTEKIVPSSRKSTKHFIDAILKKIRVNLSTLTHLWQARKQQIWPHIKKKNYISTVIYMA